MWQRLRLGLAVRPASRAVNQDRLARVGLAQVAAVVAVGVTKVPRKGAAAEVAAMVAETLFGGAAVTGHHSSARWLRDVFVLRRSSPRARIKAVPFCPVFGFYGWREQRFVLFCSWRQDCQKKLVLVCSMHRPHRCFVRSTVCRTDLFATTLQVQRDGCKGMTTSAK